MSKTLVILESGNKTKKVQKFLGDEYVVKACFGHIRDIDGKGMNIDIHNDFQPSYKTIEDKKNVVKDLKTLYNKHKKILLASDLDREGESIAFHISEALNIPQSKRKRMLFSEITKKALTKAVKEPVDINMNLFFAQQARRVLDRLIGYSISPILWKHIQNSYKKNMSLSAGRVQSVVLKLIIEREKEIEKFTSKTTFKVDGVFESPKHDYLNAILNQELKDKEISLEFLEDCKETEFSVKNVIKKKSNRNPSPPFITSTLQQESSVKFRMSPKLTMSTAQKLYENGYITYMRTDSFNLSEEAIEMIKEHILTEYGERYLNIKQYKSKSENSQEAHEAIRPCSISRKDISDDDNMGPNEIKLYQLIWNRTVASQMSPCKIELLTTKIELSTYENLEFISKSENIIFDGFQKIYIENREDETENTKQNNKFIELKKGTILKYKKITVTEKISKPPHLRFTEANLIKKLDELDIGRPSTYANMVSVVQDRNYVEKKNIEGTKKSISVMELKDNNISDKKQETTVGGEKQKLVPTEIGFIVNDFMEKHFNSIINFNYTSNLEKSLDEVSSGNKNWSEVVRENYMVFNPVCVRLNNETQLAKDTIKRIIGKYPGTNNDMICYIGKYGPVLKYITNDNEEKYAPLGDYKMDKITMEQAIELFRYPKRLNKDIVIKKGQYGLYFNFKNKNYSLKNIEENEITVEKCMELTKNVVSNVIKKIGKTIIIKKGPYGNYINYKGKNYKINSKEPEKLTKDECMKIINKK